MSELRNEILLRLSKLVIPAIAATLIYLVATAAGARPSFELGLLAWTSGGVALLLMESSPI